MSNQVIITGADLVNRKRTFKEKMLANLVDMAPWQTIPEVDKTSDWKEWNADWFEQIGYRQVLKQEAPIMKNRRLVAGVMDLEDYLLYPEVNEYAGIMSQIPNIPKISVLQQYFPVLPTIVSTLVGEHLQSDNKLIVRGIDDFTLSERLDYKEKLFSNLLIKNALKDKQIALAQMGLLEDSEIPEQQNEYQKQMKIAQEAAQIENQFKNFVTTAEIYGQHVVDSAYVKYDMEMNEKENFRESLTNAREYWHLDMRDDGFSVEALDSAYVFSHRTKHKRYASEGDYLGWFVWMTLGDVIDKFRTKLSDKQLETLRSQMTTLTGLNIMPDFLKQMPGAYYDYSKKYPSSLQNPDMVDALSRRELENRFINTVQPDNTRLSASQLFNMGNNEMDKPHMFRAMFLYWKSQRRVSYLTKIGRDGTIEYADWVDDNFEMTVPPVYDNSLTNAKTAKNLLYGEHLDSTYINEWRRIVKIGPNSNHQFWRNNPGFEPIYLDGDPCMFQFKGSKDIYEALPPFEGIEYHTVGIGAVSLADRAKPWQVAANIAGNKTLEIMSKDYGNLLSVNKATVPRNSANDEIDEFDGYDNDPLTNNLLNAKESGVIDYSTSKEHVESYGGQFVPPSIVQASRIAEAQQYHALFGEFKMACMETVGMTRERTAQGKVSQSVASLQNGIQFSESQTYELFHQHDKTMERVYQRILEATQYYASRQDVTQISYLNTKHENEFLEIAGGELHRHFNIYAQSSPRMKQLEKEFRQIIMTDNTLGASALEKAEGLFSSSSVELLEKMKEITNRKMQEDQKARQDELDAEYAKIDADTKLAQMKVENDNLQKDLDRKSKEKIAMLNTLRGMQTDVDMNSTPDAIDTLDYYLRNQDAITKQQQQTDALDFEKQRHADELLDKQADRNADIQKTTLKGEYDLKVAKENQTNAELKRKNAKKAK